MKVRAPKARPRLWGNQLTGWPQSAAFRLIGSRAIREWNATKHLLPKCGAKAKHTGEPCRQIAMANGKCYLHGGKTPKGKDWHRRQWPNKDAPDANQKLARKLADIERDDRQRAARLAKMTPDERDRYEAHRKSRMPGPPGPRAASRNERRQAKEFQKVRGKAEARPVSPEVRAIERRLAELRAERDRLQASQDDGDSGIFG
jgi:hypothetical protein